MMVDSELLRTILDVVEERKRLPFEEPVRSNRFLAHAELLFKTGLIEGQSCHEESHWNLIEPRLTSAGIEFRRHLQVSDHWQKLKSQTPLWTIEAGPEMLREWIGRELQPPAEHS